MKNIEDSRDKNIPMIPNTSAFYAGSHEGIDLLSIQMWSDVFQSPNTTKSVDNAVIGQDVQEHILMSAIWIEDNQEHAHQPKNILSGYVVCGLRHHNCWMLKSALTGLKPSEYRDVDGSIQKVHRKPIQGFLTNLDNFCTREEAAIIAFKAGQTNTLISPLFSESLW